MIEQAPDPLAIAIHEVWKFEMGVCPHGRHLGGAKAGQPYAMCEVFAAAISPVVMTTVVPQLIRVWADAFDRVMEGDPDNIEWVQDDPDGEAPLETFEGHIARHVADNISSAGETFPWDDWSSWEPRFEDHPLPPLAPPLPDGGL